MAVLILPQRLVSECGAGGPLLCSLAFGLWGSAKFCLVPMHFNICVGVNYHPYVDTLSYILCFPWKLWKLNRFLEGVLELMRANKQM